MRPRLAILLALTAAACGGSGAEKRSPGMIERALIVEPVPVPQGAVDSIHRLVRRQEGGGFPGAVVAIGNRALVQDLSAFGKVHWGGRAPPMHPDSTLFDLASLTKVVATTAAVMALVDDGRMELDDPVSRHLPAFSGGARGQVTIRHLLTHTAGVRAGAFDIRDDASRGAVFDYLLRRPLVMDPGEGVLYSDIGFVILWAAAQRAAGEPLPGYLRRRVWGPLGMRDTRMGVPSGCARCAPTLHLEEEDRPYSGGSYDEVARRLEGVAGNAGAFSTGADLARFAAAIANEGRLGEVRVFSRRTVRAFLQPQRGTRALGWEAYCREGIVPDHQPCEEILAVGHTGVTGTSLWIHPESRNWLVLLTNRTYLPRQALDMQRFRRRLFRVLAPAP